MHACRLVTEFKMRDRFENPTDNFLSDSTPETIGIPSGRSFVPLAFLSIYTRRNGFGVKASRVFESRSTDATFASRFSSNILMHTLAIPAALGYVSPDDVNVASTNTLNTRVMLYKIPGGSRGWPLTMLDRLPNTHQKVVTLSLTHSERGV